MQTTNSAGSFFADSKKLVKDYFNIRLRILQLRGIRLFAKAAGNFVWLLVFLFLVFLLAIFTGLTMGFYLSSVTGSYTMGFGFTGLFILLLVLLLIAFRKRLFINPIIKAVIRSADKNNDNSSAN